MAIRLGFIGVGGIAGTHLNAAKALGIPVSAMFDVSRETMEKRQQEFGIPHICASAKELAEHPEVDAVIVASPQHVHLEGIRAACKAKKPLFTEKPLARTLEQAHEAVRLVEEAGIVAQVGFVRRYCLEWGAFRSAIESGVIGSPVVWWMAGGGPGPRSPFFMTHDQGGGPMLDGMVHNYDFCRYIWGEPTKVIGSMVNLRPDTDALDTGTAIIEFAGGHRHTILNSWGLPEGTRSGGFHNVLGPKGVFYFGDPDNNPPDDLDTKTHGYHVSKLAGGERKVHLYEKRNMYEAQLADFVQKAEKGDRKTRATIKDGLKAQEIALAILGEFTPGQR
ncbi:MAG TPA: Gfo/Idh/MocA family oxidoreductase [Firmicutes bacterium]|nr:Gfo/Idh/MocA family oxidoreductase [Bacillota bacterium]